MITLQQHCSHRRKKLRRRRLEDGECGGSREPKVAIAVNNNLYDYRPMGMGFSERFRSIRGSQIFQGVIMKSGRG